MAVPTKNGRTLQSSTTNGAGGTTTGTALDLTTRLGGLAVLKVVNGTAPTVGCDAIIEVSIDNTNWDEISRQTAPTTASSTFTFPVRIDESILYIRSKFSGNTGNGVTVSATFHELTSIG